MRNARNSRQATATPVLALAAAAALFPLFSATAAADTAIGTINYQSKAGSVVVNVSDVYLVKGPNAFGDKTIRRLMFTSADLGAKLNACASMMCARGNVEEGMTIDFDGGGPWLDFWVVGNHQKIQASGGAKPEETLKLTTDTAQRLAGTLSIDDSASGGPKVNVKFDATLSHQYSK